MKPPPVTTSLELHTAVEDTVVPCAVGVSNAARSVIVIGVGRPVPFIPGRPCGPGGPWVPLLPSGPAGPWVPLIPLVPLAPAGPCGPGGPIGPWYH